jgi:hypothetical protein
MFFSPNKETQLDMNNLSINIASVNIERKGCCKFLGLLIDDKLTWSEHIAYTRSKLSRSLYAINRSRYLVPPKYLKTLYDSLVHPYLTYGIVLWGGTCKSYLNKIRISQRKAVRYIHRSSYNAHTNPLFSESKILKLDDIYELEVGKLVYDAMHNTLPKPLSFLYNPNCTIHSHNTRQRGNPHMETRRSVVAANSLTHKAPVIWSHLPQHIRELNTRSKFKKHLKKSILLKYT